jgi:HEPN domain-containing protein
VTKAEGDYDVILLLLKSRKKTRFDQICFHSQQCIEKYLKGRLNEANIAFPKTHDLVAVLKLSQPIEPLWGVFAMPFRSVTDWAVLPRYPGSFATAAQGKEAVKICRRFRKVARASLGL